MRTDAELLDGLQGWLGDYTGKVVCRWSSSGRGWRLHETSKPQGVDDVREAINAFLNAELENTEWEE